jgi:hypothetical protein
MDEHHINLALDVFLRDAAFFEEEDLQQETFRDFVRELGVSMITFNDEKTFVKTAQFLDWYCVEDKLLWVNLEQFVLKKERIFSAPSYVQLLSHFANQNEGTRDFYDFFEYLYSSAVFKGASTRELVTILYSFYQVHAGTIQFFKNLEGDLQERMNDKISTTDLLRILQSFSEISSHFSGLFVQLETLFLHRFDQMNPDELTCAASGFAISGFGSPLMFKYLENILLDHL